MTPSPGSLARRHIRAAFRAKAARFNATGQRRVAKAATRVRALLADGCTGCARVGMDVSSPKHRVRTGLADIGARSEQRDVVFFRLSASSSQAVAECFEADCVARRAM